MGKMRPVETCWMRHICLLLLILLILPAVADAATQKFNFTVSNNTAINFENGYYIVEVIELSRPLYARVNLTTGGASKIYNLYDSEAALTFSEIKLGSSSITDTTCVITIEFPVGWGYPKTYQIVRPLPPVLIPNIVLTKSVDKTNMNVGDVVSINIRVENTGNATAYNLTLNEQLPNGFTLAAGSRFPPVINPELSPGANQELYYALKAVESGTFNIAPASVKYGSKTAQSNQNTIAVAAVTQEKSNLTLVISLDKSEVYTDDLIKATVKITNTGKATAKSVLVEGTPPLGMQVIEGDLRQVYDVIASGETKEYRVTLKATEKGSFPLHLRTIYNDNPIGVSSDSEPIVVAERERNYLYVILPVIVITFGVVLFTLKKHKEYSY